MENKIKVGSVVKLKSGGHEMTVNSTDQSTITCIWFGLCGNVYNTHLSQDNFNVDTLEFIR